MFFRFDRKVFGNDATIMKADYSEDACEALARSIGYETYAHTGFPADYLPEVVYPVLNLADERVGFAARPMEASGVLGNSIKATNLSQPWPTIKFEGDVWKPA